MAAPRRGWQRRFNSWMDQVLGRRVREREQAESPSAEAQVFGPGTFALLGQRELDGLLVVRNDLMARYADGENMNEYPETRAAHEYFSQDSTQPNSKGKTIWVHSPDDALKGMANDMLQKRIRIEDKIYPIAYNLCMYGNAFEEVMAVKDRGVVDLAQLPPPTMRRIEREDGALVGFAQDVTMKLTTDMADLLKRSRQNDWPDHVATFRSWQVIHWRYRPTSRMSPYGYSVTDGARWIWKRLVMMEDAMLIYKLTRAPARFVWYVDVGQRPDDEVESILRQAKMSVKKKKFVDPRKNQINMRFNPLANDEDIFLAMRNGQELTRVDILQGPDYQAIDDVEYMRKKMLSVIKVPREYLGEDSTIPGRAVLSNEDVRAARVSLGIQRELRSGFETLIRIDQAARGVPIALDLDFDVMMQAPSGIYELAAMEVNNARADYAMRVRDFMSQRWILRNVFNFSASEIEQLEKERKAEQEQQMAMGAMGGAGGFLGASSMWDSSPLLTENVKERDRGDIPTKDELRKMRDEMRQREDRREMESQRRHEELLNAFGKLSEKKDSEFNRRVQHDRRFMSEIRSGLLTKGRNGNVRAMPSSPRRPNPSFERSRSK